MAEVKNSLETQIELISEIFLEESKNKETLVISHFDTDGISSASIMTQCLKKLDRRFSLKISKSLEEEFIQKLPKNKIILFLDLGSGSLRHFEKYFPENRNIFVIDHHEIPLSTSFEKSIEKIKIINPELHEKQKISSSGLTYLFCKQIDERNKEFAKLAILGMIGDLLEKEIGKLNNGILTDGEIKKKRGLLIYPSTRPINRALEFCSNPFIPGVTGDVRGVLELLREAGLTPKEGNYKSLIELEEDEMEKLVTGIILRTPKTKPSEIVGDIFLLKMFNKLEDARELSAMINACSRFGNSETAVQFCMEIPKAKKRAEAIYARYKQSIISALRFATETEKIQGQGFMVINAKKEIKDTMIGTIVSILSNSSIYEDGTVLIGMAYYDDKIKVSARNVGRVGRNLREFLQAVIEKTGGECGGHDLAAGGIINQEKESEFLDSLKKNLEIETVKI